MSGEREVRKPVTATTKVRSRQPDRAPIECPASVVMRFRSARNRRRNPERTPGASPGFLEPVSQTAFPGSGSERSNRCRPDRNPNLSADGESTETREIPGASVP